VALGLVHPDRVKTNAGARAGDVLILGKPLGVGVLSAALKKGALDAAGYEAMIASTTKLNTPGRHLADLDSVHAITDVTGFGLLGHLLEVCRGSSLSAALTLRQIPLLADAERLGHRRLHHRCLGPQLDGLRERRAAGCRDHRDATGAADRSADPAAACWWLASRRWRTRCCPFSAARDLVPRQ
jgi:selenium donor protein